MSLPSWLEGPAGTVEVRTGEAPDPCIEVPALYDLTGDGWIVGVEAWDFAKRAGRTDLGDYFGEFGKVSVRYDAEIDYLRVVRLHSENSIDTKPGKLLVAIGSGSGGLRLCFASHGADVET